MSWREEHRRAVRQGAEHYIDPGTGYLVFTECFHRQRGRCCGRGCRHCPYGHEAVPEATRMATPAPVLADDAS